MKFLILGASGMAGHVISMYLREKGHGVTALSRSAPPGGVDWIEADVYTKPEVLKTACLCCGHDIIVNAMEVSGENAEQNRAEAVYINAYLPHLLAAMTESASARIIHLSTDCVFSGNAGKYSENARRDAESHYGMSKALGELADGKNLTFRNAVIGPDMRPGGMGMFNRLMQQQGSVDGGSGAVWNGITTLELAKAVEKAADTRLTGLYRLTPPEDITKHELLCKINNLFRGGMVEVTKTTGELSDKTLLNTRSDFDHKVSDYGNMLLEMKSWIYQHKELYPHYQFID